MILVIQKLIYRRRQFTEAGVLSCVRVSLVIWMVRFARLRLKIAGRKSKALTDKHY